MLWDICFLHFGQLLIPGKLNRLSMQEKQNVWPQGRQSGLRLSELNVSLQNSHSNEALAMPYFHFSLNFFAKSSVKNVGKF
jgi:hypothetical protein